MVNNMCRECGVSRNEYEEAIRTIEKVKPNLSEMSDLALSGRYKYAVVAKATYESHHNKK